MKTCRNTNTHQLGQSKNWRLIMQSFGTISIIIMSLLLSTACEDSFGVGHQVDTSSPVRIETVLAHPRAFEGKVVEVAGIIYARDDDATMALMTDCIEYNTINKITTLSISSNIDDETKAVLRKHSGEYSFLKVLIERKSISRIYEAAPFNGGIQFFCHRTE